MPVLLPKICHFPIPALAINKAKKRGVRRQCLQVDDTDDGCQLGTKGPEPIPRPLCLPDDCFVNLSACNDVSMVQFDDGEGCIDTGATITLTNSAAGYDSYGGGDLRARVRFANSQCRSVDQLVVVPLKHNGELIGEVAAFVVDELPVPLLLGLDALKSMDTTIRLRHDGTRMGVEFGRKCTPEDCLQARKPKRGVTDRVSLCLYGGGGGGASGRAGRRRRKTRQDAHVQTCCDAAVQTPADFLVHDVCVSTMVTDDMATDVMATNAVASNVTATLRSDSRKDEPHDATDVLCGYGPASSSATRLFHARDFEGG